MSAPARFSHRPQQWAWLLLLLLFLTVQAHTLSAFGQTPPEDSL